MNKTLNAVLLTTGLIFSAISQAQTPAPTVTGTCKDGTTFSAESTRGACKGHGGIQKGDMSTAKEVAPASAAASAKVAAPATTATTAPVGQPVKPAVVATPAAAAPVTNKATTTPVTTTAPGGGVGKVWANSSTKVYHCQDDRYYGKTKEGEYMSIADAKAKGFHPSHGQDCK